MKYLHSLAQHLTAVRAPHPREHRLYLPLVVDECDVLRVRKAVIRSADGKVEIVRCAPVRNSRKVRLTIELQPGILDEMICRILQSVEAGEFGKIGLAH
ncbi:MAG: hypothetical protein WCV99_16585 [Sterolibacterium sp.]|jgi:hypothetical protein